MHHVHGLVDPGRERELNEDSLLNERLPDGSLLLVMCDGMGGPGAGDRASAVAVAGIADIVRSQPDAEAFRTLHAALGAANEAVLREASSRPGIPMGTTAVAARVIGDQCWVGWVGNSRLYHLRDGQVLDRTVDHTRVQRMVESGALAPHEARDHPDAHVLTMALGGNTQAQASFQPAVWQSPLQLEQGDVLLLCTDGLSDLVEGREFYPLIGGLSPDQAAARLVAEANRRGGHDNIAVTVLVHGDPVIPPSSQGLPAAPPAVGAPGSQPTGEVPGSGPPVEEPEVLTAEAEWNHRQELLFKRRCSHCAERVSPSVIIQDQECPHCGSPVLWHGELDAAAIMEAVTGKWRRWRWIVLALLALSVVVGGWIPPLTTLVFFVALLVVHLAIVRQPLRWFSFARRTTTRFTLKLLFAFITVLKLIIGVLTTPLYGLHIPICAVAAVIGVLVYMQVSLWLIRDRLRREAVSAKLDAWEWMLPAGLTGSLVVVSGLTFAVIGLVLYVLTTMDIPGVSDVAAFILS